MNDLEDMKHRVAVFGSSGFVGRHLVRHLYQKQYDVWPVVRPGVKRATNESALYPVDISVEQLSSTFQEFGIISVVNLGSYGVAPDQRDAALAIAANVVGTSNIALACATNKIPFVQIGSVSEYAQNSNGVLDENDPLETSHIYGATKAAGMLASKAICTQTNVWFWGLRLFNVYGPGETEHRLLPTVLNGLIHSKRVPLSSGEQIRDFVYIDDVCEAVSLALAKVGDGSPKQEIVNICTGKSNSVKEFAEHVCDIVEGESDLLGFGDILRRQGESDRLVGSAVKAKKLLGWIARTGLQSGISRTIELTRDFEGG